ncbi:RING finger protein 39-like isoform X2 [Hirundo rustica]|uniref:RING finger protein 39-like isoform X2 n=1 Tax=Hirundo rustica TaxID=43150 RepID=UPI002672986D|nr:RING finger protein 39-like isoform X2 [Hirundo rustica]
MPEPKFPEARSGFFWGEISLIWGSQPSLDGALALAQLLALLGQSISRLRQGMEEILVGKWIFLSPSELSFHFPVGADPKLPPGFEGGERKIPGKPKIGCSEEFAPGQNQERGPAVGAGVPGAAAVPGGAGAAPPGPARGPGRGHRPSPGRGAGQGLGGVVPAGHAHLGDGGEIPAAPEPLPAGHPAAPGQLREDEVPSPGRDFRGAGEEPGGFCPEEHPDSLMFQLQEPADVTLDPRTAHRHLQLSEDGKEARGQLLPRDVPDHPERFDFEPCVLARGGFTSGRHFWEVEVGQGGVWALGVVRESARRRGPLSLTPKEGVWALEAFHSLTSPRANLRLQPPPRRLRVSLDYEGRRVAFFSAGDDVPILEYTRAAFNGERVLPWFKIGIGARLLEVTRSPRCQERAVAGQVVSPLDWVGFGFSLRICP